MKKPTVKLTAKGHGSLYLTFLKITLLPLLFLGIVIVAVSASMMSSRLQDEVRNELRGLGSSILASYDSTYPGDYDMVPDGDYLVLKKGDAIISYKYDMLQKISQENDVDISIFFSNIRVMSTIANGSGNPFVGDEITSLVTDPVMKNKKESFFNNVTLQDEKYFCYYRPILNSDGSCVGMIGIGKSADSVASMVHSAIIGNMLILIGAILITACLITYFTVGIVKVIRKLMDFLKEISKGNLDTNLDYIAAKRTDELGEMGKTMEKLQFSLRKLVEQDPLTDLMNRRSGGNKISLVYKNAAHFNEDFCISIGDIDLFKKFNDTYGHEAGDEVLKEVARILKSSMMGNGYAIRWGGEEFLLVFERMNLDAANTLLKQIVNDVRNSSVIYEGNELHITMTFGIVQGTTAKDIDTLINDADMCLYKGKENGRNQIVQGS